MSAALPSRLRVAAIDFLNPAPLLYSFDHDAGTAHFRTRYHVQRTSPAQCAEDLRTGAADLGLVPIGALPELPGLLAVPGCTIASLQEVRSIQLILRPGLDLADVRSVAADAASRSSVAYVEMLLRCFYSNVPVFTAAPADLTAMLGTHDAALLIGDPALLAIERRDSPKALHRDATWIDVAALWHRHTGLPWVAAVWAVRPEALNAALPAERLIADLNHSRSQGLAHMEALVESWAPRIALPPATIRRYLTFHIHYHLDEACLAGVERFYELGRETGILRRFALPLL